MIRVLIVDDHPALRAGLTTVLRGEPGIHPVGVCARAAEVLEEIDRSWPDVVIADQGMPDESGLSLCARVKALEQPPAVIIYSGYADLGLSVPAAIAGADGLISKAAPVEELIDAIRLVARGASVLPPISPASLEAATATLDEADLPVVGMALNGTPRAEIAEVLAVDVRSLDARIALILERLGGREPSPTR